MHLTLKEALTPKNNGITPIEDVIQQGLIHTLPKEWLTPKIILTRYSNNRTLLSSAIESKTLDKIPSEIWEKDVLIGRGVLLSEITEMAAYYACFHQLPEQYKNNIETFKHPDTLKYVAYTNPIFIKPE
jgi:hypothetical protein